MYFNLSNLLEENRIVKYQNKNPEDNLVIIGTRKIIITATKIIFVVVLTRCVTFFI
jgi:hypothetical protein